MAADYLTFYKELPRRFIEMGCICPSSPWLAKAMVRPLKEKAGQRNILEVGPGTGPFTRKILKNMNEFDTLTICEINPSLLAQLKRSLRKNPYYLHHKDRVHFVEGPAQHLRELYPDTEFDAIICGLPFSNFPADTAEQIITLFQEMLSEDGSLSFFEYLGMRKFGSFVPSAKHRKRIRDVEYVIQKWKTSAERSGAISTDLSLFNLPPALAVHYTRD